MRTLCCSDKCEKRFECARADINNEGMHYVENFYSFGTGTYTDNRCIVEHWCGELGDYKMFEPIGKSPEEAIQKLKNALAELDIAITNANGKYRLVRDILNDISVKWDDLKT